MTIKINRYDEINALYAAHIPNIAAMLLGKRSFWQKLKKRYSENVTVEKLSKWIACFW